MASHPDHPYVHHRDLDGRPIAFAHRGGTCLHPENTMEAFEHAVSIGYRYLETDAHLSRDGVLVAFHDPDLRRTCGIDGAIAELPWAQIADAEVDGRARIPRLSDLLDRFPDVRFNIDAKSDAAVEPLCDLIDALGAHDRVCVASFGHARLRRIRQRFGQRVITNLSPFEVARLMAIGRLGGSTPLAAQVPIRYGRLPVVTRRSMRRARAAGIPVHVWTVNERTEMEWLLDIGVDGIMTDETELLRDVFAERDLWPD